MIGYTTVGTNNLEKAISFYGDLSSALGAKRFLEVDNFVARAVSPEQPAFSVCKPYDGNIATAGNGTMIALTVSFTCLVDKIHARALPLGGSDDGAPGPWTDGIYAGFFRDLDGNKLNVFLIPANRVLIQLIINKERL